MKREVKILKNAPFAGRGGSAFNDLEIQIDDSRVYRVFLDRTQKRVIVSDEGYWNPLAPIGEELKMILDVARENGYRAGVVLTPYAYFDEKASLEQLIEYVKVCDFFAVDPYLFPDKNKEWELLVFTEYFKLIAKLHKIPMTIVKQGFATDLSTEFVRRVKEYNKKLDNLGLETVVFDATDFDDIPDHMDIEG